MEKVALQPLESDFKSCVICASVPKIPFPILFFSILFYLDLKDLYYEFFLMMGTETSLVGFLIHKFFFTFAGGCAKKCKNDSIITHPDHANLIALWNKTTRLSFSVSMGQTARA
ncbi:hypothetical protein M2137_000538 [Parabacteroides sp. PFB2-10]|uniref:hypothetical protein n=1 Tax=Parabacteroides sp. PFB2-10 TaxID=1742405 RepID=UPI002476ED0F|nr:hypothetical protein [Parabacteroides sp. PFB2-10]MDH6311779.1 hypothetical protein [Parabacteroides sp. PFB2-10]